METVRCDGCREMFARQIVRIAGKTFGKQVTTCPGCLEARRVEQERERAEARQREDAARLERLAGERLESILDLMAEAGVNTAEHGHCTLENWEPHPGGTLQPLEAVRRLLAEARAAGKHDPVRGVYLVGTTGSGKSHLAVAALRDLLLDPRIAPGALVYDTSLELIGEIQDTYTTGKSAKSVLERRKRAALWIVDDFGTENPSPDVVRRLTEIFSSRAKRPTLVTSNTDPNDLEDRHRDFFRLFSRFGPDYFDVVAVHGRDRRMDAPATRPRAA